MDRRQKKSREAIYSAFEHLLTHHSYDKITVSQIIDLADVGRTTFYAHFETKDALLEEMCTDLFNHVFSDYPDREGNHDFSLSEGDSRTVITHILYHIKEKGNTMAKLIKGESSEVFLRYFKQYINEPISVGLLSHCKKDIKNIPKDFLSNHVSGSFVNAVQWWIQNDLSLTPEELAQAYLEVIEPILQ